MWCVACVLSGAGEVHMCECVGACGDTLHAYVGVWSVMGVCLCGGVMWQRVVCVRVRTIVLVCL